MGITTVKALPNKRLKPPGGDRLEGSGVFCPDGHERSFNDSGAGELIARRLARSVRQRP